VAVTARRTDQDQDFAVVRFLREVFDELRKVVWPTPGELWRYTMVVVATVVVLAVFIGGVDLVVGEAVKRWVYSGLTKTG
jgi:preprotein translocase subunit SecE